jgi:CheY-like chemotaxis protein
MDTPTAPVPPTHRSAQTARINPNSVLADLQSALLMSVGKDVALTFTLGSDIHPVRVGQAQFERLVVDLVVNAAAAIEGQGRVTVETRLVTLATVVAQRGASLPPGRYVVIAVTDTGRGMTAEARNRLFQLPSTAETRVPGDGCGLGRGDTMVRAAGGLIFVDSEIGAGTAVTVLLPVAEGDAVSRAGDPGGDETILLIDDSVGVRTLVRRTLERLGYQVFEASSGAEAHGILDALATPIDLVLCDVILSDSTGAEIVRQIQGRVPGVRSIFMSGHTVHTLSPQAQLPEGANFIQKPFERPAFAKQLREVLCG